MEKKALLYLFFVFILLGNTKGQSPAAELLPAKAYQKKLTDKSSRTILDVRTPEEFASQHLEGAVNINIQDADFKQQLEQLDKNEPVFVYCKGGGRSANAANQLKALGFSEVYDLQGGIMAWENKELPLSSESATPSTSTANKFTKADFDELLEKYPKVLIDFYAEWCAPCKVMEPTLAKLDKEYEGRVKVVRLNVDEAKALCKEMNIEGLPILAVYQEGREVKRVTGLQSEDELINLIETVEN